MVWVLVASLPQVNKGYRNIVQMLSLQACDELDFIMSRTVRDWFSKLGHGSWPDVLDSDGDLELFFEKSLNPIDDGADIALCRFIPRISTGT